MEFFADKVSISGPTVDGSYNVKFTVGEWQRTAIKDLIDIDPQTVLEVSVKVKND